MSTNERETSSKESELESKSSGSIPRLRRTGCAATSFFETPFSTFANRYSLDLTKSKSPEQTPGTEKRRLKSNDTNIEEKKPKVPPFKIADVRKTNFDIPGSSKRGLPDASSATAKIFLPTLSTSCTAKEKNVSDMPRVAVKSEKNGTGYDEFKALHSKLTKSENRDKPKISKKLSSSLNQLNTSNASSNSRDKFEPSKRISALVDKDVPQKIRQAVKISPKTTDGEMLSKRVGMLPDESIPQCSFRDTDNEKPVHKKIKPVKQYSISLDKYVSEDIPYETYPSIKTPCRETVDTISQLKAIPSMTNVQEVTGQEGTENTNDKPNTFTKKYLMGYTGTHKENDKDSAFQKMLSKFEPGRKDNTEIRKNQGNGDKIVDRVVKSGEKKECTKTDLLRQKFESKIDEKRVNAKNVSAPKDVISKGGERGSFHSDVIKTSESPVNENKCLDNKTSQNDCTSKDFSFIETEDENIFFPIKDHSRKLPGILNTPAHNNLLTMKGKVGLKEGKEDLHLDDGITTPVSDLSLSEVGRQSENANFDLMTFDEVLDIPQNEARSLSPLFENKISELTAFSALQKRAEETVSTNTQQASIAKEHQTAMLGRIVTFKDNKNTNSGTFKDITNFKSEPDHLQQTASARQLDFENQKSVFSNQSEFAAFSLDCEEKSTELSHTKQNNVFSDFDKTDSSVNLDRKVCIFDSEASSFDDDKLLFENDVPWSSGVNDSTESFKERFIHRTETGYSQQNFTSKGVETHMKFQKDIDKENQIYSGMTSQSSAFRTERLQRSIILNQRSTTSTYTKKLQIGRKTVRTSRYTR